MSRRPPWVVANSGGVPGVSLSVPSSRGFLVLRRAEGLILHAPLGADDFGYLQIFNTADLPPNGAVPLFCSPPLGYDHFVPPFFLGHGYTWDFGSEGIYIGGTGVTIALSATPAVFTAHTIITGVMSLAYWDQ